MAINLTVSAIGMLAGSLEIEPQRVLFIIQRVIAFAPIGPDKPPLLEEKQDKTPEELEVLRAIQEVLMPAIVMTTMRYSSIDPKTLDLVYDILSRKVANGTCTPKFLINELLYG